MLISEQEKQKYTEVWQIPSYSNDSPGVLMLPLFLQMARPKLKDNFLSILDIGAGAGAASRALEDDLKFYYVKAFDLVDTAWTHEDIDLYTGTLWELNGRLSMEWHNSFDYGYCCDVLEHIPTEYLALAVDNILRTCSTTFFSVCFKEDNFGALVGKPLHLTVRPFTWWRDFFKEMGTLIECRDLGNDGVFLVRS